MNENIDLTKILKNCPKGTKLYSSTFGEVEFQYIVRGALYPIVIKLKNGVAEKLTSNGVWVIEKLTSNGVLFSNYDGECALFPSKEQKDWSKFTAPWYKKEKFDPKTLKPFDKIIARVEGGIWFCELLSFIEEGRNLIKGLVSYYNYCIPYNDDTKHLIGTTEESPEYYRYWEE